MSDTLPAPSMSEIQGLISKWAKILKVQDWEISLEIVRQYKIPGCWAETAFHGAKRIARIRLLDPSLPVDDDDPMESHNVELSIIHELLHIKLVQIEPEKKDVEDPLYFDYHASLDQLATAFYELSRPLSMLNLNKKTDWGVQLGVTGAIVDVPPGPQSVKTYTVAYNDLCGSCGHQRYSHRRYLLGVSCRDSDCQCPEFMETEPHKEAQSVERLER